MPEHTMTPPMPSASPGTQPNTPPTAPIDFLDYWKTDYREIKTFRGHSHGVWAVAFSPDGLTLASGGAERLVRIWDIETGRLLRSLRGHTNDIPPIVYTPDGQTLATASEDRTIRLWNPKTGEPFSPARQLLSEAVDLAFPGCVVEVGCAKTVLWQQAFGSYAGDASSPVDLDTVYDLASLTKVIATTSIAMRLADARRLTLDSPVRSWLKDWRGDDRSGVTVRDLLAHAAGLTAYAPFYRDCRGRAEFEAAICELPLEY